MERLKRQYELVRINSTDPDKALDFCLTAWSLADWLFYEKVSQGMILIQSQNHGPEKRVFREPLFLQCPDLRIMHDIANGTKHFELTSPKTNVSSIEVKEHAAFNKGFSFGFNRPGIKITFDTGEQHILNIIIKNVWKFWNSHITTP